MVLGDALLPDQATGTHQPVKSVSIIGIYRDRLTVGHYSVERSILSQPRNEVVIEGCNYGLLIIRSGLSAAMRTAAA